MLSEVSEGQVGIFEEYGGGEFYGYVIKTPEQRRLFEPAEGLLLKLRPRTGGGLAEMLSEDLQRVSGASPPFASASASRAELVTVHALCEEWHGAALGNTGASRRREKATKQRKVKSGGR